MLIAQVRLGDDHAAPFPNDGGAVFGRWSERRPGTHACDPNGQVTGQAVIVAKLPCDPLKNFEYIGQVMDVPMALLVRKDLPAHNFRELLAYVKVSFRPSKRMNMASTGIRSSTRKAG